MHKDSPIRINRVEQQVADIEQDKLLYLAKRQGGLDSHYGQLYFAEGPGLW